jgi:mRNA-degrading endonuclease RelE of RelBE toxin-antitoxin system
MFSVIGTETYLRELKKWPEPDKSYAEKIPKGLAINPLVGKQLSYKFLREKKIGGRRVYYLVYDDLNLVLLVATSSKKDQSDTIKHLKKHLDKFRELVEKISKVS